jgi:SAM-dependent methyltransferase
MYKIKEISNQTIDRYSSRYRQMGHDIKTLGWGTKEQQEYRFIQTLDSNIEFNGKSILDIGCGFGDYLDFIIKNKINLDKYIGYDINLDLINEAKKNHSTSFSTFHVENILNTEKRDIADIGVMLGVLNFNLKDKMDNLEYSKLFIRKAFNMIKDVLIVDFLSTNLTQNYEKEDFVFYHDPAEMLSFAFTLSNNVVLKHNYAPIPQKEFMLFIYKD